MSQLSELLRHITEDPNDPYVRMRRQVEDLRRQLGHVGHDASRLGSQAADNAGDVFDEALKHGSVAARAIGQQLQVAGRQVTRDPLPILVAIGTLALVTTLLARR